MHFGDGDVGAASFGHGLGRIGSGGRGYYGAGGGARFHDLAEVHGHGFNRNAFGSERAWDRWGDRHWGAGWHRWGGWYGPVFWPYLYGDVLTYSLWPGAYYDPFWAYGPDAFMSGIFWPGPYYSASSNGQYNGLYDVYGSGAPMNAPAPATAPQATSPTSGMTVTCSGLAPGVTGLPIDHIIAQAVEPTCAGAAGRSASTGPSMPWWTAPAVCANSTIRGAKGSSPACLRSTCPLATDIARLLLQVRQANLRPEASAHSGSPCSRPPGI
jgi:hypothetical protein